MDSTLAWKPCLERQEVMSKQSDEVVVIGAGMGGLAAATRLAKSGFKVRVFEAGPQPGGKCRTVNIDGHFSFEGHFRFYKSFLKKTKNEII